MLRRCTFAIYPINLVMLLLFVSSGLAKNIKPGGSLAEEYLETLGLIDENRVKRGYMSTARLISFTQSPSRNIPGLNLSMDISGCGRSVHRDTLAGIYTYSNGTIQDDATVGDILVDLKAIRQLASESHSVNNVISNHTLAVARKIEKTAIDMLDGGLICKSTRGSETNSLIHSELRRLLWLSPEARGRARAFSLRLSIILAKSIGVGGIAGGVILSWTWLPLGPKHDPNLPDSFTNENAEIRELAWKFGIVAGAMVFVFDAITAIIKALTDAAEGGARGINAAEAFPIHIFLAVANRLVEICRMALARYRRQSASSSAQISSFPPMPSTRDLIATSSTGPSSPMPTTTTGSGSPSCVPENVAVDMTRMIGDIRTRPGTVPIRAFEIIERFPDLENQVSREAFVGGRCYVHEPY